MAATETSTVDAFSSATGCTGWLGLDTWFAKVPRSALSIGVIERHQQSRDLHEFFNMLVIRDDNPVAAEMVDRSQSILSSLGHAFAQLLQITCTDGDGTLSISLKDDKVTAALLNIIDGHIQELQNLRGSLVDHLRAREIIRRSSESAAGGGNDGSAPGSAEEKSSATASIGDVIAILQGKAPVSYMLCEAVEMVRDDGYNGEIASPMILKKDANNPELYGCFYKPGADISLHTVVNIATSCGVPFDEVKKYLFNLFEKDAAEKIDH